MSTPSMKNIKKKIIILVVTNVSLAHMVEQMTCTYSIKPHLPQAITRSCDHLLCQIQS